MSYMNGKKATRIHKQALLIYRDWMVSMLPEEEVAKIKKPENNHPVYDTKGTARSIPYSYRGAKRFIKNNMRYRPIESITIKDIEWRLKSNRGFVNEE